MQSKEQRNNNCFVFYLNKKNLTACKKNGETDTDSLKAVDLIIIKKKVAIQIYPRQVRKETKLFLLLNIK